MGNEFSSGLPGQTLGWHSVDRDSLRRSGATAPTPGAASRRLIAVKGRTIGDARTGSSCIECLKRIRMAAWPKAHPDARIMAA